MWLPSLALAPTIPILPCLPFVWHYLDCLFFRYSAERDLSSLHPYPRIYATWVDSRASLTQSNLPEDVYCSLALLSCYLLAPLVWNYLLNWSFPVWSHDLTSLNERNQIGIITFATARFCIFSALGSPTIINASTPFRTAWRYVTKALNLPSRYTKREPSPFSGVIS